jgi:hypothetical protein
MLWPVTALAVSGHFYYTMGPTISLTKRESGLRNFEKTLVELRKIEVLVGIPEATAQRKGEKINNPSLLYIHTHGSPARGP